MEKLTAIEDYMTEGAIVINQSGEILLYNQKAKEIFGLQKQYTEYHSSGSLEPGDIVVIVNTHVGIDDGSMDADCFSLIGIQVIGAFKGRGLLCAAKYKDSKAIACQWVEPQEQNTAHLLEVSVDSLRIRCTLDYARNITNIEVNSKSYLLDFYNAIAHMVVIRNQKVIFYQHNGYTARKESIRDILIHRDFQSKAAWTEMDIIGRNIFEIHPKTSGIMDFYKAAQNQIKKESNSIQEINGIPVFSKIYPLKSAEGFGALLTVSTLDNLQQENNEILSAIASLKSAQSVDHFKNIIGQSHAIQEVKRMSAKASGTDASILITGESGTGKSFLAKEIHLSSKRKEKPFLILNCAAIPPNLIESELFGYGKGAFTGALNKGKMGLLKAADGGTLFLDEIGDMPVDMQTKLLIFLQNKKFYPIGSVNEIHVDVRIIAASNKNLETAMKTHTFREDLYYRLNVIPIHIAPLRHRMEDLNLLVEHVMDVKSRETKTNKTLSAEARKLLLTYHYPGNIRELENIVERAISLTDSNIIFSKDLMIDETLKPELSPEGSLDSLLNRVEKEAIIAALTKYNYNAAATYKSLGISKSSFYEKIKKHGIKLKQ